MGEDRFKVVLGVDLILENEYKTTQNIRSLDLLCSSYSGISGLKRNDGVKIPLQYTLFHRNLYLCYRM